ncbi:MAG: transcriptional regulator [Alphaproteobacteria bacterium]|nr:transcriptional regulator [Alphaproteobacteria bacterium]
MEIRPIKTEQDYEAALGEIETLMDAEADTPDGERLDILGILVEAWEEKHFPIEDPHPIDAIKFRMEQQGLEQRDLGNLLGSRSRASEILNRKRALTLEQIRIIAQRWQVPADVLIANYDLDDGDGSVAA